MDIFRRSPDTHLAAKGGSPAMTILRPGIPVSVPQTAAAATTGTGVSGSTTNDVTIGVSNDTKELDSRPDARANPPAAAGATPAAAVDSPAKPADAPVAPQQPFATNHPLTEKDRKLAMKLAQQKAKRDKKAAAKAAKQGLAPQQPPAAQPQSPAPAATPAQTPPQ
jgi:hypothetical protein